MGTSVSPIPIELSSDSEVDSQDNTQSTSQNVYSQDEVFTLDCGEDDYPPSAYDLLDFNNEEKNESLSSAETVIYALDNDSDVEIICEDTPAKNITDEKYKSTPVTKTLNETVINAGFGDDIVWEDTPVKERNNQKPNKKVQKEIDKLLRQKKKLELKEKKAEELKQKRIKHALVQQYKNLKPEECIKLLNVNVDVNIVNSEFGGVIIASLQEAEIKYSVANLTQSNTISWSKTIRDVIVSDDGVVQEDAGVKEENQLFYLMPAEQVVGLVRSNELFTHVQTILSLYEDKILTVVILKMKHYLEQEKRKHNKGKSKQIQDCTIDDVEDALMEMQLFGNICHWFIETAEDLAVLITSTTKSISQLDYKRERQKQDEVDLDWYAKADSKQCVKVDKSGNGLTKLWQQQICQFHAIGHEVANAITAVYPSPRALIEKYKSCTSTAQAELLLQDIQIRRNAGILSSSRRIGPEFSKKMYHFYMSDDPDLIL